MTTRVVPLGENDDESLTAERVVRHLEAMIECGDLKPGDRLPPERELAQRLGVSRPSVRAGLRSLVALGVVESRHGAGSFITAGPPRLSTGPLSLMAALHGFTRDEMFEARLVLEVGAAGLAAERAQGDDLAAMSEEVAGMFASLGDPHSFLLHDVRFHRAIAVASHNPVLAALVEMVSTFNYERRRLTVERSRDLKEAADLHRRVYAAVRDHDVERARLEMTQHLDRARRAQAVEDTEEVAAGKAEARRRVDRAGAAPAVLPKRRRTSTG
jgi:GntR family transcriptional regulator, transcriptional repressor for pyruvate dehydrogenase complex